MVLPPPAGANGAPIALQVVEAPAAWGSIDFISDLHLQASQPRSFAALREHLLQTPADAVFILGDLFEAWIGDDAAETGFERECAELFAQATRKRTVAFMPGNRDFLVGPAFLQRTGLLGLSDPTLLQAFGQRFLLSHGDALCLADQDYQRFRAMVRDPAWQAAVLAQPLARRREMAAALRAESRHRDAAAPEGKGRHDPADSLWADVDTEAALAWLRASGARQLIHGHTHRPADHDLAEGCSRHVLSDWELDAEPGVVRADVLRLSARGLQRLPILPSH